MIDLTGMGRSVSDLDGGIMSGLCVAVCVVVAGGEIFNATLLLASDSTSRVATSAIYQGVNKGL